VASKQPKYLEAMCIWEGASDWYRDMTHHGGILSTFWANWFDMQVKTVQYGLGENGPRNNLTGELICGNETHTEEELALNRCQFGDEIRSHPFEDEYHHERSAVWENIKVPLLSAANWGGQGLHLRGNTEGYIRAASNQKWLEIHGLEHWTEFYTDYGVKLQKRFFGHFLKGENNDWANQPKVQLQVRHLDGFKQRNENQWPIDRTEWQKLYLSDDKKISTEYECKESNSLVFNAMGEGIDFHSEPFKNETEMTGPLALKIFVSSSTSDADIFVVLRLFGPSNNEIVFQGAVDPNTPIAQGWLRASHRKLDLEQSKPWRPFHTHDESWPLKTDEIVEMDIEIWPTSIVIPENHYLCLSIQGKDYEYPLAENQTLSNFKNQLTGCGPFLHDDPIDRDATFNGKTTIHFNPDHAPYLMVPVIPEKQ